MDEKTRVVVMMGGPSTEYDVSLASGIQVFQALAKKPHLDVQALTVSRQGQWELMEAPRASLPKPGDAVTGIVPRAYTMAGIPLLSSADVVFIAFHGQFGEDGTVQGLLESLGLAYTGSGPLASGLAMNKAKAKELFRYHGLQVPPEVHLTRSDIEASVGNAVEHVEANLAYPVVVKPNLGGSSLGVTLADDAPELEEALRTAARFGVDVLIEPKLQGREVTCAVLENFDGSVRALPVIEIVPKKGAFFDFASKYEDAGSEEICPAVLSTSEAEAIQEVAMRAHLALGCEGFSRTDMFLTPEGLMVLEVNTIPGMTPNSLLPKAAQAAGIPFEDLMAHLVELARIRQNRR